MCFVYFPFSLKKVRTNEEIHSVRREVGIGCSKLEIKSCIPCTVPV